MHVSEIIDKYYESLPSVANKKPEELHQEMIGVHVRMVASVAQDTPGLSGEEALRMELATAFRVSCHYRYFLNMMASFSTNKRFFLSADSPEAYSGLRLHPKLKGRVFILSSAACTDRSPQCLLFAAADLVLLTRTSRLLVSRWSAFSETAAKIGGMQAVDACDQPAGGWHLEEGGQQLAQQIISYLRSQNYPDVSRVEQALQRFQ